MTEMASTGLLHDEVVGEALSVSTRLEAEAEQLRTAADMSQMRREFAKRAAHAAWVCERLDKAPLERAAAWRLVCETDPLDDRAIATHIMWLLRGDRLDVAHDWVNTLPSEIKSRAGFAVAQAKIWAAAGRGYQAIKLLRKVSKQYPKSWPVAYELVTMLSEDHRYEAALLVLRRYQRMSDDAAASPLLETTLRKKADFARAGQKWADALLDLSAGSETLLALLSRVREMFWKQDPLAGHFGIRSLLRCHPPEPEFLLNAMLWFGGWRSRDLAVQSLRRFPDNAKLAFMFMERINGPALNVFYGSEVKRIIATFPHDLAIMRHCLVEQAWQPESDAVGDQFGALAAGQLELAPAGLQVVAGLHQAIRSADPATALDRLQAKLLFQEVAKKFPVVSKIAAGNRQRAMPATRVEAPRVAICISGQLRSFFSVWPALETNVIKPLQADVFIDTWRKTGSANGTVVTDALMRDVIGSGVKIGSDVLIEDFPMMCEAILGKTTCSETDFWPLHGVAGVRVEDEAPFEAAMKIPRLPMNQAKMFYKMAGAFALMQQHEEQVGRIYDAVMRIRSDFLLRQVDITELLAVLERPLDILSEKRFMDGVDDQFAFGSRRAMEVFHGIWPAMLEAKAPVYTPIEEFQFAERLVFNHVAMGGIRIVLTRRTTGGIMRRSFDWLSILPALLADLRASALPPETRRAILEAALRRASPDLARAGISAADIFKS